MDEELNEHDLEERLYAMLHHVDETQNNVNQTTSNQIDATQLFENGPRSTIRRYWRTSAETNPHSKAITPNPHFKLNTNNPYVKVNTNNPHTKENSPKPSTPLSNSTIPKADETKPKEEKGKSPTPPPTIVDLSIFQSPIPQNVQKVIEIIDHDNENNRQVLLESSDEDEVVEVALPPKPTITIESSDEDELSIIKPDSAYKTPSKQNDKSKNSDRAVSASPVPSVVSSVSDDFIRGDCIALNISSQPANPSFDFSLHGPDLIIQNTPSKKKRKRKNKEAVTSTPIAATKSANQSQECFATPKSKAKKKKKAKTSTAIQKSVSVPEIDDCDSDQSIVYVNNNKNSYTVTEKSLPSADVYESDSNQSEMQVQVKETTLAQRKENTTSSDSSIGNPNLKKTSDDSEQFITCDSIVDLTENENFITIDDTSINESIVIANVSGFMESEASGDDQTQEITDNISKYVSSKVPSILNADLDFDNLKGKEKVCKKRRYSLTTLRAEMEKFYNESWGGEDFNHREIQKNMSRDKSLWAIDPKDRMPTSYGQRNKKCNYCNRAGHRDDSCMRKPAVCHMCGNSGHYESRCPSKICVNCGSPNHIFTNICRNCSTWGRITCEECKQKGHPSSHCPDLWRRYHNTTDISMPLERCFHTKQWSELYCSGCSRRGHLVHTCRGTVPFASQPINSPYVCVYRPLYTEDINKQHNKSFSQDYTVSSATMPNRTDGNKRLSKSPAHENHLNKKRTTSASFGDELKTNQLNKNPANTPRQNPLIKEVAVDADKNKEPIKSSLDVFKEIVTEKAPDFIPLCSSNHDNKGQVIQDNEVSDTSDVVTSARIYVTNDVYDLLTKKEHQEWLKETVKKLDITVQCCGGAYPFLSIKGKVIDQESFQYLLRDRKWNDNDCEIEAPISNNDVNDPTASLVKSVSTEINLPKNRYNLLRQLTKALDSLQQDLGDPKAIHKELTYLQNRHEKLLTQKVISPKTLSNNRTNINNMHKRLNTVLLGQAGLANGASSVIELYSYKDKLSTLRGNNISLGLRREIGQHFYNIFSSNARDDYSELLQKYDPSKPLLKLVKNKKKDKPFMPSPKLKKISMIPQQQNLQNMGPGPQDNTQKSIQLKKLMFYHQRLKNAKPKGTANKKAKVELVRKFHTFIASMFQRETLSSKALKKVKKVQQEAQNFLSANV